MNVRTLAFAVAATIAFGTSAVSLAQTAPGPQGTPPPPPVPNATSTPLLSTSPQPTAAPSIAAPTSPAMTPTPDPFASASPAASASPSGGKRGRRPASSGSATPTPGPSPTDTPEPPQFSTLDGVWEIALQPLNGARTVYSHLYVTQSGNTLSGTWRRNGKPTLPFSGTFDGRLFKVTVGGGTVTEVLSGYEENFMDMVGLYVDGVAQHPGTPFTAAHRKRDRDRDVKPK